MYRALPPTPSSEQCSMMSSKTQRAAVRSVRISHSGEIICWKMASRCCSKCGRNSEWSERRRPPKHSTRLEISASSRSASASASSASSSSASSSCSSSFRAFRRSLLSLKSISIIWHVAACCGGEKRAASKSTPLSTTSAKYSRSNASVSMSGSDFNCSRIVSSITSFRWPTSCGIHVTPAFGDGSPLLCAPMQELSSSGIAIIAAVRTSSMYWNLTRGSGSTPPARRTAGSPPAAPRRTCGACCTPSPSPRAPTCGS